MTTIDPFEKHPEECQLNHCHCDCNDPPQPIKLAQEERIKLLDNNLLELAKVCEEQKETIKLLQNDFSRCIEKISYLENLIIKAMRDV